MSFKIPGLLLMLFVLDGAADHPARADAARGGQLARQWCASCHVIDGSAGRRRSTRAAEL